MRERIFVGRQEGIHPLEAIGGSTSSGPTIPFQNPMGGTQVAEPVDNVAEKTKKLVMEKLEREADQEKYKYSLLVPVSMKPGDTKKYWGLNSHYFGYTFIASSIQAAANGKEAWEKIVEQLSPEQISEIKKIQRENKLKSPGWIMDKRGIK